MYNTDGGAKVINLAPAKPLREMREDAKDAHEWSYLASMLREFNMEVRQRNADERQEIAESGRRMANIRSGKLVLRRDPTRGGLVLLRPLPHRPRKDLHVYPLAQMNSSQLTSIWTLSRPRVIPRHFGNTNKAQIQHAALEQIINEYDAENFNEEVHQRESLSMMDYGCSVFRVDYDIRLNTIKSTMPIIQDASKTIFEGYQFCKDCPKEGTPKEFQHKGEKVPRCPDCGSYKVSEGTPEQVVNATEVVGAQDVSQGDILIESLDVPASNWDMRYLVKDSDFFTYRSEISPRLVRAMLDFDVQESGPEDDVGLGIVNALGSRGGSVEGEGRENLVGNASMRRGAAYMDECYFDPSWYIGTKLEKAEKTVSGETIPADVPLEKIFPDGIYGVGFNDWQVVPIVMNRKRRVQSGVYHIQSHSGVGQGTQSAAEVYEQLNSAHSANLAIIKRHGAGGGWGYDKEVMTHREAQKLLKPGEVVGMQMRNTRYNSVENAIQQVKAGELSNANMTMVAQLSNLMNISFQTTEFTSGVSNPNIDINTARGQEMLAAQNQQRSAAPLRMKGFLRARIFEDLIELYRECIKIPRYIGHGDRFALSRGRMISGDELPERVRCDFMADSEIPLNRYTKSLNSQNMLEKSQFFGVPFVQLAQMNPRMAAWWADQFQVDMPLFNQHDVLIVCQGRIDDLKELTRLATERMEMAGMMEVPPEAVPEILGQLRRKVFVNEENHAMKASVLGEYLDDDEVEEWSDLMRLCVEGLIQMHKEYDVESQMTMARLTGKAQVDLEVEKAQRMEEAMAPAREKEAAGQQAAQQAAMQQAAEIKGLEKAADLAAAEEDFQREQEGADLDLVRQEQLNRADFQRERMLAAEDHVRNIEIKKYEQRNSSQRPSPGKRS